MSSSDEEEGDNLSDIDFSVISTSIQVGGTMVNQIVNSVNYGSPEVRYLLQNECDFIIECKVCRNFFRNIPLFVAHKRIYCRDFFATERDNIVSQASMEEETIVVQPQSADVAMETEPEAQTSTIDQLKEGTFHGTSAAYKLYTQAAQKIEMQKSSKTLSTVTMTEIPTNPNAVTINVEKNLVNQSNESLVNQSNGVLQNDSDSIHETVEEKEMEVSAHKQSSELMKMLTKKTEQSPESTKGINEKSDVEKTIVNTVKGKNFLKSIEFRPVKGQNVELRPVKSQDATITELTELSNLGHCDVNKLKCLICSLCLRSRKSLLQHMHSQHSGKKTVYPCSLCDSKFSYFWGLTRHLKINHKKSKEQVDKMRIKLRSLMYTVSLDNSTDENAKKSDAIKKNGDSVVENGSASETVDIVGPKIQRSLRTSGGITLNKCEGCGKAFWKRQSYGEHVKHCKWVMPSEDEQANVQQNLRGRRKDRDKSVDDMVSANRKNNKSEMISSKKLPHAQRKMNTEKNGPLERKSLSERFIKTRSESRERSGTRSESSESRSSRRERKEESPRSESNDSRTSKTETRVTGSRTRETSRSESLNTRGSTRSETKDSSIYNRKTGSSSRENSGERTNQTRDKVLGSRDKSGEIANQTRGRVSGSIDGSRERTNQTRSKVSGSSNESLEKTDQTRGRVSVRSDSKNSRDASRSESRESSTSSRSVSKDTSPTKSEVTMVTEKQMVTRNIATRRGEFEKKPSENRKSVITSSAEPVEPSENKKSVSNSTAEPAKETDVSQTGSSASASKEESLASLTPRKYMSTRQYDITGQKADMSESIKLSPRSRYIQQEKRVALSNVNTSRRIETRSSDTNSAGLVDEVDGSRTGSRAAVSSFRKPISTRSSDADEHSQIEGTGSSKVSPANKTGSRNSSVERDSEVSPHRLGTRGSRKDKNRDKSPEKSALSDNGLVEQNEVKQSPNENSEDISRSKVGSKRRRVNSGSSVGSHGYSEQLERSVETRSGVDGTGNTYIIDGVEISEMSEAQVNARSSDSLSDPVDNENMENLENARTSESFSEPVHNEDVENPAHESHKYTVSPNVSEITHIETRSSRKDKKTDSGTDEKKSNLEISGNEKRDQGNVKQEMSPKKTRSHKHVAISHEKETDENNDEKKKGDAKISGVEKVGQELSDSETVGSLQNFPDIQMITRRSLEKICPKDDAEKELKDTDSVKPDTKLSPSDKKTRGKIPRLSNTTQDSKRSEDTEGDKKSISRYPCLFCSKDFSYYWGVTRHLKINHFKTKSQVDKLKAKLKAKAYTVGAKKTVKRLQKTGPKNVYSRKSKMNLRQKVKKETADSPGSEKMGEKLDVQVKVGGVDEVSGHTRSRQKVTESENMEMMEEGDEKISEMDDKNEDKAFESMTFRPDEDGETVTVNPLQEKNYLGVEINSNSNKVCIEEIWVGKEPGQPSKSIRCQKVIIESESGKSLLSKMTVRRRKSPKSSPDKSKARDKWNKKMYVIDPGTSSHPRCLDSKRVDALIRENHSTAEQYCLQCGLAFSNVSNLRRHIVRHLGWMRYKCKLCSFASYNKSECSTHLRRTHAEKLIGASISNYVIDLNKEANKLRTEKKLNTMSLRKTDLGAGNSPRKSYWYRDRNLRKTAMSKMPQTSKKEIQSDKIEENVVISKAQKRKKIIGKRKKYEDRRKPGIRVENIKQPISYNISTRNSSRTFDTSPYKNVGKMETLTTRQSNYPKDEKTVLKTKRDILADIDSDSVLSKLRSNTESGPPESDHKSSKKSDKQSVTMVKSNKHSVAMVTDQGEDKNQNIKGNKSVGSEGEKPVVRKRKRSDSEGKSPDMKVKGQESGSTKTSPSERKSKISKENEGKWKLKRSFSHDGIPSSHVSKEEDVDIKSAETDLEDTASLDDDQLESQYTELRQTEPDVRLAPSLKTMMAALEEARASIKKRGRNIKRSISPVKKIPQVGIDRDRFRRHSVDVMRTKGNAETSSASLDSKATDDDTVSVKNSKESGSKVDGKDLVKVSQNGEKQINKKTDVQKDKNKDSEDVSSGSERGNSSQRDRDVGTDKKTVTMVTS